jgi:hypothetical protein
MHIVYSTKNMGLQSIIFSLTYSGIIPFDAFMFIFFILSSRNSECDGCFTFFTAHP